MYSVCWFQGCCTVTRYLLCACTWHWHEDWVYWTVWPSGSLLLQDNNRVVVLTDLLKGRAEDLKPNPYLRKSPSLESLSRPPSLGFTGSRLLGASPGGWKPQSKLRYPSESVPPTFAASHQLFWWLTRLGPELSSFYHFTLLLLGPPSPEVAAHPR